MKQLILQPEVFFYTSCSAFVEEFKLNAQDLVLTNEYIYKPYFGALNLDVQLIFQEKYGAGEPTDEMVDAIIADMSKLECNRIIAIGGGTVIDIAKVLAVSTGGTVDDLFDNVQNLSKKKELVILPTTCGTGSEVTNLSIINRTRMGTKLGLASGAMYADQAVLVPQLMETLPFPVFATSSIDALVHAVESVLSPKATPFTKLFGYKAIDMIIQGYQTIEKEGQDARIPLLADFLIASNYAGISFGTAGCAAVHATSYLLGGNYHVPHGESNYAMFTGVLECYYQLKQDGEIAALNAHLAKLLGCEVEKVYQALESLLSAILPKKALREYGMKEEEVASFAKAVIETQGRLMANNFVPLSEEDVRGIYQKLY